MSEEMIGYEEVEEVVKEAHERLQEIGPEAEMGDFNVDYDSISQRAVDIFGRQGAAHWIAGMHAGLCIAQRYWEYRVPKLED